MVLTVDHKETVHARARRDPEFRWYRLTAGVERLLAGEFTLAKYGFRDCIAGVGGFEALGQMTGKSPESLEEMFSPESDPRASDLLEVITCLLRHEGLVLQISMVREELQGEVCSAAG